MKATLKNATINNNNEELVVFAQTVDFAELFDHVRTFASVDCDFHTPTVKTYAGNVHITFTSHDITEVTGPFAAILKRCYFHSNNNQVYKDKDTGELAYWVSVNIRYEHKDGGSNGMDMLWGRYQDGAWVFSDSGYKAVDTRINGYRLNTQLKDGGWVNGAIDGFRFHAKVYDTGSRFGINNGRVSKLEIRDRKTGGGTYERIVNYDRGWEIEPADGKHKELFETVLSYLEGL